MISYKVAVNHSHSIIYNTRNQLTGNKFIKR